MKKDVNKVGRPKLADKDLKVNSYIMCLMGLVLVMSLMIGGIFSFTNFNSKKLSGAVAKTYVIKYNKNGGTGSMPDQIITYGKNTPLTANKFTKDGYYFVGWKAWRSQDSKWYGYDKNKNLGWYKKDKIKSYYIYKDKIKVSKTAKKGTYAIMYADWKKDVKPGTYKIEFNANGGKGTMKDQIITYGKNTPLTANKFTKDGYYFVGWKAWRSQDSKWYGYDKNENLGWYKKDKIKSYYIYKDKIGVSKTTKSGTYAIMYAVWEKSSTKLDVTAVRTTTFTVESQGNNCYKITAPTVADYWSVEVKYRSATSTSFEKKDYISSYYWNDKVYSDKICLKNQKYKNEVHRVTIKWVTGSNGSVYGNPKDWRPNGWSYNKDSAYKDFIIKK